MISKLVVATEKGGLTEFTYGINLRYEPSIDPGKILEQRRTLKGNWIGWWQPINESKLERRLKREVQKVGGKALKFESPGMAGVPDRLVLLPGGKLIFVEMKAPGETLRPLQEKRAKEIRSLGFSVLHIDSIQAIEDFIRGVTK